MFGYSFHDIVEQTYTFLTPSLSVTSPTFDPVSEGYAQPDPLPITNTGTGAATIAAVMLTGANADCFTLNTTGGTVIAAGAADDTTYTVQPVGGLAPDTYTAAITAYYDNGAKATADVTFSVLPPALTAGENTVSFEAVYEEQLFRFTPSESGVYRFRCDGGSVDPTVSVFDGSTRVAFIDRSELLTGFNCSAELEGGKTYTVQLESLNGTGDITVLVQAAPLYHIYTDSAMAHGSVTVEQGGVSATDASAISAAYAGADVILWAEPEEGYALAELRVLNAGGETVSTGTFFNMPAGDVTVSAVFDKAYTLSYEGDDHVMFYGVRIDGLGLGDSGGCEVFAGQQVAIDWNCEGDYMADSFSVTADDNATVPYEVTFDENTNMNSLAFTMPAENVHVTMTSRPVGFDDAAFTLPSGTQYIGESAFEGDTGITSLVIPQGCRSVGKWAFRGCENLERVRVPADCAIGEDAFLDCAWVWLYSAEDSPAADYCDTHDNCMLMVE